MSAEVAGTGDRRTCSHSIAEDNRTTANRQLKHWLTTSLLDGGSGAGKRGLEARLTTRPAVVGHRESVNPSSHCPSQSAEFISSAGCRLERGLDRCQSVLVRLCCLMSSDVG